MLKNARQFANKSKGGELPRESTTSEAEAKKTDFLSWVWQLEVSSW